MYYALPYGYYSVLDYGMPFRGRHRTHHHKKKRHTSHRHHAHKKHWAYYNQRHQHQQGVGYRLGTARPQRKAALSIPSRNGGHELLYVQHTGQLFDRTTGQLLDIAVSGRGWGKYNPAAQFQKMIGPIPRGQYRITPREGLFHGRRAFRLTATEGTQLRGRNGFLIHRAFYNGSEGCIGLRSLNINQIARYGSLTVIA